MSGNLYARYVPNKELKIPPVTSTAKEPSDASIDRSTVQRSKKRRSDEVEPGEDISEDATREKRRAQKAKKEKKSSKHKLGESAVVTNEEGEHVRRSKRDEKIFAKYDRSTKRAELIRSQGLDQSFGLANEPGDSDEPDESNVSDDLEGQEEADGPEEALELHGLVPLPQPDRAHRGKYNPDFSALPTWIASPVIVDQRSEQPFTTLGLSMELVEKLRKRQLTEALPIQAALIPLQLSGAHQHNGDLCVSAPTGSGKTLAYVLPLIEKLKNTLVPRLRAVIVVPTRELVAQVRQEIELCAAGVKIRIGLAHGTTMLAIEQHQLVKRNEVYDAAGYAQMVHTANDRISTGLMQDDGLLEDLENLLPNHVPNYRSDVDLLICTPGRLVEHVLSTRGFSLKDVQHLIIDEADRLIDDSFQEWVDVMLSRLKSDYESTPRFQVQSLHPELMEPHYVRKVILSATMTRDLAKLAALKLVRPMLVAVSSESCVKDASNLNRPVISQVELPPTLEEMAIPAEEGDDKPLRLLALLETQLGFGQQDHYERQALIFANSNEDAQRLCFLLSSMRPHLSNLIGTLTKSNSTGARKTLSAFKQGKISILVASDRASRGLDLVQLTDVINYDMPRTPEEYVHRVGRTARAGRPGSAWTLFTKLQARWFWNDIARSPKIRRMAGHIQRLKIDLPEHGPLQEQYQAALDSLKAAVVGNS